MKVTLPLPAVVLTSSVLIILIASGSYCFNELRKQSVARTPLTHSLAVIEHLHYARAVIKDAEIARTAYVLTGQDEYSKRIFQLESKITSLIGELRELTKDNPIQLKQLDALQAKTGEKFAELNGSIEAMHENRAEALRQLKSMRGINLVDDIRRHIETMMTTEEELLDARSSSLDADSRKFSTVLFSLFTAAIILLLITCISLWGLIAARQKAIGQRENKEADLSGDIVSRKKIELDLIERESKTKALLSTAPDAIVTFSGEGIIETANDMTAKMFGWQSHDLVGTNISRLIPGFFKNHGDEDASTRITAGQSRLFGSGVETTGIRKDGTSTPVELAWSVLNLGEKILFTVIIRDQTERKKAEEKLALQYDIGRILTEATSIEEVTKGVLENVGNKLHWSIGEFWAVDQDQKELRLVDQWSLPKFKDSQFVLESKNIRFGFGEGLPGRIWKTAEPFWIEDVCKDEQFVRVSLVREIGLHTAFGVPVSANAKVLGVCQFFSDQIIEIDDALLKAMTSAGNQIGPFFVKKQAEISQKKSDEQFRAVFNNTASFMSLLSLDGTIIQHNRSAENLGEVELGTVLGKLLWETSWSNFSNEDQDKLKTSFYHARDHRKIVRYEMDRISVVGERTVVDFSLTPIFDVNGSVNLLLAEGHDITALRKTEEELRLSRERYDLAVKGSQDGIWDWDLRTNKVFYSDTALNQLGYVASDIDIHKMEALLSLVHPGDLSKVETAVKEHLELKRTYDIEYRLRTKSGDYMWIHSKGQALWDESGRAVRFSGSHRDINERIKAEERVSEFYSTVSHELRTPLTSIRGSLGLIVGGKAGDISEKALAMVKIGKSESERLIRLINDILDVKKIEAGQFELHKTLVDPRQLVAKTFDAIAGMALQANITLKSFINAENQIFVDNERLMQVLTNLISNAIKFSPKDSEVSVKVDALNDKTLRFSVVDEGPGIPHDKKHKLFGKFQQLDSSDSRRHGGTGLGLSISKAIIEQHGGDIGVETEPGKGSIFWFDLPVADGVNPSA